MQFPFLAPSVDAGGTADEESFLLCCNVLKLPRYGATNPWSIHRFGDLDTALRGYNAAEETTAVQEACPKI